VGQVAGASAQCLIVSQQLGHWADIPEVRCHGYDWQTERFSSGDSRSREIARMADMDQVCSVFLVKLLQIGLDVWIEVVEQNWVRRSQYVEV
jgi:hypothetical protein